MVQINQTTLASNISAFGEENQRKISNASVSILGQNETSDYITMMLIGLGVKHILIQGKRNEKGLEPLLSQFDRNPHTTITRHNAEPLMYKIQKQNPDIIFSIEKDKLLYEKLEQEMVGFPHKKISLAIASHKRVPFTNTLLAGYMVDQFRKILFQTCSADKPRNALFQNIVGFNKSKKMKTRKIEHALVIGAGGIGTYLGLELAKEEIPKITIVDNDKIESKNLNRQLLYLDNIGCDKSSVLAQKLSIMSPSSVIKGLGMYVQSKEQINDLISSQNIDFVYCATDNFESRIIVSQSCEKLKIPLIEAGCNTTNAVVSQYEPGKTNPIHITRKFLDYIKPTNISDEKTSCIQKANPSVVIPNAIAGGLMYGASMNRTSQGGRPQFISNTLHYDTFSKEAFYENEK